ncbi:MAG: hypothetical protein QW128_00930 [Thermoprotei archaeon]
MGKDVSDSLDDYYRVISNKNAWRIISYIGENGSVRATKAIRDLNISAGLFYDTIKRFDDIILKQEDGTYTLSERGRVVYWLIRQDDAQIRRAYNVELIKFIYKLKPLFPLELFRLMDSMPYHYKVLTSVVMILSFALISGFTNIRAVLIYGWPTISSFGETVIWYMVNILILFLIMFPITKLLNRNVSAMSFLTTLPLAFWPQVVYMLFMWVIRITQGYYPRFSYLTGAALSIFTVFMISTHLYVIGKVNIEYSMIIALLLLIISLLAILAFFI